MKVSVSILDCDFLRLGKELKAAVDAGADAIHLDVMDGHFVPNLSFGVPIARLVRSAVSVPVYSHLMVEEPEWLVEKLLPYSDRVIFHVEATELPDQCIETIAAFGKAAGISLNPSTDVERLKPFLPRVQEVLVMSVFPGLGGQEFIPESTERVRALCRLVSETGSRAVVAVDGGVNADNCRLVAEAGASEVVAGSAIFRSSDYARAIASLKCSTS